MNSTYEKAWKSIICPTKFTHNLASFCPKSQTLNGHTVQRIDFTVRNEAGKVLSAVLLKDEHQDPEHTIFYFHGNGGSKVQCLAFNSLVSKHNIAVISFDFVGCGNSDPGYLTYGINQLNDAEEVLRESDKYFKRTKLTLWGRSMGALTAILFAEKHRKIVNHLVLDSPFRRLEEVVKRVIKRQTKLPDSLCSVIVYFLDKQITQKLGFSVFKLDYLQSFKKISPKTSVLFFYSESDEIVWKEDIIQFYTVHKGQKQIIEILQQHQQERNINVYQEGILWLKKNKTKKKNKLKLKLAHLCGEVELQRHYVKQSGFCCSSKMVYV